MNHEDAFLQSILDDPDDNAPRLVYADWLADHGELERAAFIRAQCRLAALEEDDPARPALLRDEWAYLSRAQEALVAKKRPAWLARLPARIPQGLSFARGFPACWKTTAKRFAEKAEILMQGAPIQHAQLTNVAASVERLASCEALVRLRSLDLSSNGLKPEAVRTLVASPHLSGLRCLRWQAGQLTNEKLAALADAPWLAGVRDLDLSRNAFRDAGAEAFVQSPHLGALESLNWDNNNVGPRGGRALAGSEHLVGLRKLQLSDNPLGDAGAEALARSDRLAGLSSLDVEYCKMGLAGVRALLNPLGLPALTRLRLGGAAWPEDAWLIEPAERLRGGVTVYLPGAGDSAAQVMADSPLLASCRGLEIGGELGDEGARALATSPVVRRMEDLRLVWCHMTSLGVRALAASPHFSSLRKLSLEYTRLNDEAVAAILEAPLLRRLTHLNLSGTEASTESLWRLARAPALEGIAYLRLAGYGWGTPSRAELRQELEERFGPRLALE